MCPSRRFQKSSKPAAHAVSAIRARDYLYTKLMSVARTAHPRRLHRRLFLLALRALDAAARLCWAWRITAAMRAVIRGG